MKTPIETHRPGFRWLLALVAVAWAVLATAGCGGFAVATSTPAPTPTTAPLRTHVPSHTPNSPALLHVYDASGGLAAGLVDIKSGPTLVDIAGFGYRVGEKVTLTIETGTGSTTLRTDVLANLNGAFLVTDVELPSSIREGDVATIKAAGDQGTSASSALAAMNANRQN